MGFSGLILTVSAYLITFIKIMFPTWPIGFFFAAVYFLFIQLIKVLMEFSIKNNVFVINACHFGCLNLKIVAICFTILDVI